MTDTEAMVEDTNMDTSSVGKITPYRKTSMRSRSMAPKQNSFLKPKKELASIYSSVSRGSGSKERQRSF